VIAFAYTFAFSLARHNLKESAKDKQTENIDHDVAIRRRSEYQRNEILDTQAKKQVEVKNEA
jgi:hypothetical protein